MQRSFREGGKVRNETLANLSHLPPEVVEALRKILAEKELVEAGEGWEIERSLPHGHMAAAWGDGGEARHGQCFHLSAPYCYRQPGMTTVRQFLSENRSA